MRGPQKDRQNKGEEGGPKNGTGALTLGEGGFLNGGPKEDHQNKGEERGRRME
jgi:hypothetical protein